MVPKRHVALQTFCAYALLKVSFPSLIWSRLQWTAKTVHKFLN